MGKRLWIAGAGSFGREVFDWASDIRRANRAWEIAGFLDDNTEALHGRPCNLALVGPISTHEFLPDDRLVIAIADPVVRKSIAEKLQNKVSFETLIHPSCVVGTHSIIGEGSILCPYATVTTNTVLGKHTIANLKSTITHDIVMGDYCTLCDHVDLCGCVKVGEGAFFGSHAAVTPGVSIGDFAYVGAGATVINDVPAHTTVISTYARPIPRR